MMSMYTNLPGKPQSKTLRPICLRHATLTWCRNAQVDRDTAPAHSHVSDVGYHVLGGTAAHRKGASHSSAQVSRITGCSPAIRPRPAARLDRSRCGSTPSPHAAPDGCACGAVPVELTLKPAARQSPYHAPPPGPQLGGNTSRRCGTPYRCPPSGCGLPERQPLATARH